MDEAAQHEAEKKELTRLLGTANSEERKDVIRKAIAALDSSVASGGDKFSPIGSGNYAHLMNSQKIPLDKMKAAPGMGGGIRPLSARNRSTSNLEVIHENVSHIAEARRIASALPISPIPENCTYIRLSSQDCLSCVKIRSDDVAEVVASSSDPRFPAAALLPPSGAAKMRHISRWFSTGLVPQVITLHLRDKWHIRQVEVVHSGVKKMSISFFDKLRRSTGLHAMMTESSAFIYSDRKEDSGMMSARSTDATDMISFTISEIEGLFVCLGEITIFAEKETPKGSGKMR